MSKKILSVFIDESGDFGSYDSHSPYYIVAMVLHDQHNEITANLRDFETHMRNIGYGQHAVHTVPLIRRESVYKNDLVENRKRLFHALFHFLRKLNIKYTCAKINKFNCPDVTAMTAKLSNELIHIIHSHESFWNSFDHVIIYYDNGQVELTKILTSVFRTLYTNVEFRKVKPVDYKLFQIADLICTMELLSKKAESNSFSKSELEFFNNIRNFKKNYLKHIRRKYLG